MWFPEHNDMKVNLNTLKSKIIIIIINMWDRVKAGLLGTILRISLAFGWERFPKQTPKA